MASNCFENTVKSGPAITNLNAGTANVLCDMLTNRLDFIRNSIRQSNKKRTADVAELYKISDEVDKIMKYLLEVKDIVESTEIELNSIMRR